MPRCVSCSWLTKTQHCSIAVGWLETSWWRPSLRWPAWESFLGSFCLWAPSWVPIPAVSDLNCSWKPSLWSSCCCLQIDLPSPSASQGKKPWYDPGMGVLELCPYPSVKYVMLFAFFALLFEFFCLGREGEGERQGMQELFLCPPCSRLVYKDAPP